LPYFSDKRKNLKSAGRGHLKLDEQEKIKGTPWDLELEEGDRLFIPANPRTVQVMGAVMNPTAFVFRPGLGVGDYIIARGMHRQCLAGTDITSEGGRHGGPAGQWRKLAPRETG
jgi:hypothetical protein